MLDYQEEKQVKKIVDDALTPVKKQLDKLENNIDKVLKIVTRTDQELSLTKSRVDKHEKRLTSPASSSVFA